MAEWQPIGVETVAAFLVSLTADNVPPDVRELLTQGNPALGVKPGALQRALNTEWQPIETAPKDGTRIDVWYTRLPGRVPNVFWKDGMWWWGGDLSDEQDMLGPELSQPAYWMPLPSPPMRTPEADR